MMIDALQQEFAIPGALDITAGKNGLPKIVMTHATGAGAEVYLHGAHVTSWTTDRGEELLFVSRESHFAPQRPIRGGIPVIFPQFGGGALPQHGFARISDWQLLRSGLEANGDVTAVLQLTDSDATRALWPYPFRLTLTVQLAHDSLALALQVENAGEQPFPYNAVFHTYFAVADIREAAVHGLAGVTYIDSLREDLREVEARTVLRFAEETDRIYAEAPDVLTLEDAGHRRTVSIQKRRMPDVVVWNPWMAKAQRMPDFGDDEYQRMVCVETGNMAVQQTLAPSAVWRGETRLSYTR